jgi:hypothetical protein
MRTLVINPSTRTISVVELEGEFLDAVRREIGATQLAVVANAGFRFAVWCDNLGMFKPDRAFWRFGDAGHRFAGASLITAITDVGAPTDLPVEATPEAIEKNVVWYPSESLKGLREQVLIVPDDEGRPVPAISREVVWNDPDPIETPDAAPTPLDLGWSVFEREDGTYRAVQYRLTASAELEPMAMFTAPNLDEVRAKLPPGLTRVEPGELDNPELVESWT